MKMKVKIWYFFLIGAHLSKNGVSGLAQSPPLVALQEDDITLKSAPGLPLSPVQAPVATPSPPIQGPSEPEILPPAPAPLVNLLEVTKKDYLILTEHHIDFAAMYSIIRHNIDLLREQIYLKLFCKKGVCIYPMIPLVMSHATKYYVTSKKNYSILVTVTLAPREPLEDRLIYQVDLDNIILSQLKRQYAHLELFLQCFKRVCLVPLEPFKSSEHNAYCNYQDLTEACTYVTSNVIINFETDYDNSVKIDKGEAGNVAITSPLR